MKRFLSLFLFAILYGGYAMAYDFSAVCSSGQTLYYNIMSSTEVEVTCETNNPFAPYNTYPTGDLVIPSTVTNNNKIYSVTSIGYQVFYGCNGLISVVIGDSVSYISQSAFSGCSGLISVTIGVSVTNISQWTFSGCSNLTTLNFNAINCSYMGVVVSQNNYHAFNGCTSISNLNIGENVVNIPEYAFYGFSSLTSITIPNSVTNIGDYAFYNCNGLTSVTIGNGVTSIGSNAFYGTGWFNNQADGLVYLDNWCIGYKGDAPMGSLSIEEGTRGVVGFNGCTELTSIVFPNSVTTIGKDAFAGCSGLTGELTIPSSVINIGESAFARCTGLSGELNIPNSVTSIDSYAFSYCTGLSSVILPNSVTNFGYYNPFVGCSGLTEPVYNEYCFAYYPCGYATEYTIPDGIQLIAGSSFQGCSGLTEIVIPNSMKIIGSVAFSGCSGLTSIDIPESVISIGDYTFQNCNNITSLSIPNSVKSIGYWTFDGCDRLRDVIIGNSIESIDFDAFVNCYIQNVYYTGSIEQWCGITFGNENANPLGSQNNFYIQNSLVTDLVIPNNITKIKDYAFCGISGISSITIGDSIKNIGYMALGNCYEVGVINFNAVNCTDANTPFYGSYTTKMVIGENVEGLPVYFFNGFYADTLYSKAVTPPNISDATFQHDYVNEEDIIITPANTLIVPCFAVNQYLQSSGWNNFSHIEQLCLTVAAIPNNNDYGSVSGGGTYAEGTIVTLVATPNEGYRFVSWNDNSTENPRQIIVTENAAYVASFAEVSQVTEYTIIAVPANQNQGSVTGGGTYPEGAIVTLTATASDGFHFVSWDDSSTENPRTITVTADAMYIATFESDDTPQPIYLTITDTACGSYTWNEETYTETNSYYQTFTASNSADSIVRLDLVIYPLPEPEIIVDGILDACNPESASVSLSTGEYSAYNWSTGETSETITVTEIGNYYVEVVDGNGCHGVSEMATVGYSSVLTEAPQLKRVGMSNTGTNIVQWIVTDTTGVRGFEIYRENTEANVYELIGTIENPRQRSWTDPTAEPTARAYRYKICDVDECGGLSPLSDYHKTMHLTINRGMGTDWNLIWSHYEGFEYATYKIYRGTNTRDMIVIGQIPSTLNSFTDNTNTLEEGMFYKVEIVRTRKTKDGEEEEEIPLYSNIVANEFIENYTVTAVGNNVAYGTVAGGGTYPAGLDITLMALPNDGYEFVSWSDGSTENPRVITVSGNEMYIATFTFVTGINDNALPEIALFPNPATDILNITSSETISEIEIVNVMGQIVKRMEVNSDTALCDVEDLKAGVYIVKISTASATLSIQKFAKE